MSIFLIRHGETALNAARVLQPADTPLSERGVAQANRLARRLAGLGVGLILSSDLPRARRTAEAIAAATGAPITTTPLLQERNFGLLRGRAYDSLAVDPITSAAAPPGGESMAQFERRVGEAWQEVVSAATAGENLAVVSHGLVIRLLLARIVRPERLPNHLGNTSLSILDEHGNAGPGIDPDTGGGCSNLPRFVASLVNCTRHLDRTGSGDDPQGLSGG